MLLISKEHQDLMAQFDKEFRNEYRVRLDKEKRESTLNGTIYKNWEAGRFYEDGYTNALFLAYRKGYALAKCHYQTTEC